MAMAYCKIWMDIVNFWCHDVRLFPQNSRFVVRTVAYPIFYLNNVMFFQAEKLNIKFVSPAVGVGLLSKDEKNKIESKHLELKKMLKIPRR